MPQRTTPILPEGIDPVLRMPTVTASVALSKGAILQGVKLGTFPAPIKLGPKAIGWRMSAIKNWLDTRKSVLDQDMNGGAA